jgi:hypothetical protein
MEVTQRLIEKYHLDLCSSEERKAVEAWLMSDEFETEINPELEFQELSDKEEMWNSISEILPAKPSQTKTVRLLDYLSNPAWIAVAASVAALVVGLFLWNRSPQHLQTAAIESRSNKIIQTAALNITLGQKSKANVQPSSLTPDGHIHFCGAILIQSKKDVELTLNGTCENPLNTSETISFKKGQTYIAVNYNFKNENELIIVDERNISNLPPILQKEILKQFNI